MHRKQKVMWDYDGSWPGQVLSSTVIILRNLLNQVSLFLLRQFASIQNIFVKLFLSSKNRIFKNCKKL